MKIDHVCGIKKNIIIRPPFLFFSSFFTWKEGVQACICIIVSALAVSWFGSESPYHPDLHALVHFFIELFW